MIISKVFKNTTKTTLNIEFHLFSIENHLNIIIYDSMLCVIINSIYLLIKSQRTLFDRQLILNQTQHQNMFYVQFNFLHKSKMKYATIFKKKHHFVKTRNYFFCFFVMKIYINRNCQKQRKSHHHTQCHRNHEYLSYY